jgi:chromosome partitioning protein
MIIVIGGIKGGSGKTTLATNLAVCNVQKGRKTLLVDADDQGSSSDWADQRESFYKSEGVDGLVDPKEFSFPTISLSGKNLYQHVLKLKNDYDDIFIDTGGRDTVNQRSALVIANCYLIPFKPRSFDVWTVGKVKEIIHEIKTINPELKVVVCINQGDFRGMDNEDAFKILAEVPEFKCITTFIGHRKAFSNAAAQGLGVLELDKDQKAKDEILAVYDAIYE